MAAIQLNPIEATSQRPSFDFVVAILTANHYIQRLLWSRQTEKSSDRNGSTEARQLSLNPTFKTERQVWGKS